MDDEARELIELLAIEVRGLRSQVDNLSNEINSINADIDELYGWQQSFDIDEYVLVDSTMQKVPQAIGGTLLSATATKFTGTAYVSGRKITGLNSNSDYPWVRVFLDTATAEEHAGPAPSPFPANEEWYEKANHAGDIHADRA